MQIRLAADTGTHRSSISPFTNKDLAFLHSPYPESQGAIKNEVRDYGPEGSLLRGIPTQLVVCVERDGGHDNGAVAEGESDIGEEMRLLKFERG